jgi:predicted DNA-binding WGR domain protein
MRYFELVNDKSSKFWQVHNNNSPLSNTYLEVTYGKIGSNKYKTIRHYYHQKNSWQGLGERLMNKLIEQKLKKGYVEVPGKFVEPIFELDKTRKGGKKNKYKYKNCCLHNSKTKKCVRKDGKIFNLPRKFSRKKCLTKKIKGYSMKSSCAPYKFCKKTRKQFLYNPDDPSKSFDVYVDKNPSDTIKIKYTTVQDVKNTIEKLEKLYREKKYSHKRIWQVGMIMKVRLEAIKKNHPNSLNINERFNLANKYFIFLGNRTNLKSFKNRSLFKFKY